jgi:hypothetical protein
MIACMIERKLILNLKFVFMKQALNKTKMITMGLFTLCTMGLSQTTFAGVKTDDPVELKFIGNIKNQPVFQLKLNNSEIEEYSISIKDEYQNLIYSEKVKGINLSRKYQLAVDEADFGSGGVTIEITSVKTHKAETYKISSSTKVIENFEVAKL